MWRGLRHALAPASREGCQPTWSAHERSLDSPCRYRCRKWTRQSYQGCSVEQGRRARSGSEGLHGTRRRPSISGGLRKRAARAQLCLLMQANNVVSIDCRQRSDRRRRRRSQSRVAPPMASATAWCRRTEGGRAPFHDTAPTPRRGVCKDRSTRSARLTNTVGDGRRSHIPIRRTIRPQGGAPTSRAARGSARALRR